MISGTGGEWLVLLEAADERERSTMDPSSFARLVSAWTTPAPTTLYSPNRYALQVAVRATDPASALASAISLWKDALRRAELAEWDLVRAEIMTPEKLEQELQAAEWDWDGQDAPLQALPDTGDVVGDDLLRRALYDSVTGLPTRELFLDDVRRALAAGPSPSAVHVMLVVHLDGLETVDSLACSAPDDVMVEIAGRLTEMVRDCDTVARVGPAEFALLVEASPGRDTDCLARRIVDRFRGPLLDEGLPPTVRVSVGVATSSPGGDADQLILMAGMAMVVARAEGGNCHRPFASNPDSV